jgi:hypothetical protein
MTCHPAASKFAPCYATIFLKVYSKGLYLLLIDGSEALGTTIKNSALEYHEKKLYRDHFGEKPARLDRNIGLIGYIGDFGVALKTGNISLIHICVSGQ